MLRNSVTYAHYDYILIDLFNFVAYIYILLLQYRRIYLDQSCKLTRGLGKRAFQVNICWNHIEGLMSSYASSEIKI